MHMTGWQALPTEWRFDRAALSLLPLHRNGMAVRYGAWPLLDDDGEGSRHSVRPTPSEVVMKRSSRYAVLAVAAILFLAPLRVLAAEVVLQPGSTLELQGKSTMHDFEAKASKLDATFKHDATAFPTGVANGTDLEKMIRAHGVTEMNVIVPVTGLHSGKDGLDKNMYKSLLAEKNPEIRFVMKSYEVADGANPGEMAITAKGALTVAGVEQPITMSAAAHRDGEVVKLHGSVPLLMTQFGIKPPRMMMGAIKVADQVVIGFDLVIGAGGDTVSKAE
jgi:polyisoprenoid-binding protein YceI